MGTTTGEADDRVVVSEGEVRAGELCVAKQHLAELLLAYRGYVILEDALPVDFVRTLARAFQPLYDACTSAAASEGDGRIWPPRYLAAERAFYHCTHQRWRIQPRLVPPMSDPALLANPIVLSLVRARLQASFHCRYVSSDTCAPGAVHQAPHSDVDTRTLPRGAPPCGYVLNVALAESGLHNGPLEVWPGGSHLWAPKVLRECGVDSVWVQDEENEPVEALVRHFPSVKITLRPGDLLLRDPAMWHRGTPNPSQEPRPMLTVGYFRDDFFYVFGDTSQDVEAFWAMEPEVQALFQYRFNLGKPLFWKTRRCPWPGSTRISVGESAALWTRWWLTRGAYADTASPPG